MASNPSANKPQDLIKCLKGVFLKYLKANKLDNLIALKVYR